MPKDQITDGNLLPVKSVTTLELHSEDQDTKVDVTMATPDESAVLEVSPQVESTPDNISISKSDDDLAKSQETMKSFSIDNLIAKNNSSVEYLQRPDADSGAGDNVLATVDITHDSQGVDADIGGLSAGDSQINASNKGQVSQVELKKRSETVSEIVDVEMKVKFNNELSDTDNEVKTVLSHIEDLIVTEMTADTNSNSRSTSIDKNAAEDMEINNEDLDKDTLKLSSDNQTSPSSKGQYLAHYC